MKMRSLLAASAISLLPMAGTASAAVTVVGAEAGNLDGTGAYSGLLYGHQIIQDFDSPLAAGFSWTFNDSSKSYGRSGGLVPNESAPPPVPVNPMNPNGAYQYGTSEYWTVEGGGSATLTRTGGGFMRGFSFYLGSPDDYNHVTFKIMAGNTVLDTLSGEEIWNDSDPNAANGSQTWGHRVYYDFGADQVTSITFSSTGNSFEFDGLAVVVPEPSTWALMIVGFGGAGAMIRRRKMALA